MLPVLSRKVNSFGAERTVDGVPAAGLLLVDRVSATSDFGFSAYVGAKV
jgi:hypothetical protein